MRAGFVERPEGWVGDLRYSGGAIEFFVTLPSRFPFKPARISPVEADAVPWSWHRERDGSLCLVADDDHDNLWWIEAEAFLDQARAWLENSIAGWIDDRPDLDLDRYFESSSDGRLYLFGDLEPLSGRLVRFEPSSNDVMRLAGPGVKPSKVQKSSKRIFGIVVDIGSPSAPPRNWDELSALIAPAHNVDARIRDRSVSVVVVRYERAGQQGVIALEVWPNRAGGISAFRVTAGSDTLEARSARSGPDASKVKGKMVAVVGAGALGSFIADGLTRGGVELITVVDGDRLMPGNLVRHLVGSEGVGLCKATAVKRNLERRFPNLVTVTAIDSDLTAADEAVRLIEESDLVINATADFAVTALLGAAAGAVEKTLLSVAIQNEGWTFRIDVMPPLDEVAALPSSARRGHAPAPLYFDSGCGSPISPTPPSAVIEAASAAVRHAFGLLLSTPIAPDGEVRDLDLPEPSVGGIA